MSASTADILGDRVRQTKIHPQWSEHHKQLSRLRGQLLKDKQTLIEAATEGVPTFSEHMADAATDSYDRDWTLSLLSSGQEALYEIEQALDRITQGTYGVCELSGQPIEPERLSTIPWARFSMHAQLELENKGSVSRVQFAQRGTLLQVSDSEAAEDGEETAVASVGDKDSQ
ncbi:MAG: transcriptional regulator, TraR/DksA family [Pedosphaera sp.]|nr:transcriptional regulator, TraR/DksA family [Pedosphaera sp.]